MSYINFYTDDTKKTDGTFFLNIDNNDLGRLIVDAFLNVVHNEVEARMTMRDYTGLSGLVVLAEDISSRLLEAEAEAKANAEAQGQQGVEVDTTE